MSIGVIFVECILREVCLFMGWFGRYCTCDPDRTHYPCKWQRILMFWVKKMFSNERSISVKFEVRLRYENNKYGHPFTRPCSETGSTHWPFLTISTLLTHSCLVYRTPKSNQRDNAIGYRSHGYVFVIDLWGGRSMQTTFGVLLKFHKYLVFVWMNKRLYRLRFASSRNDLTVDKFTMSWKTPCVWTFG